MGSLVVRLSFIPALLLVIGVPFLFRPPEAARDPDALRLVIVTPHQENIRAEFQRGFDRWHRQHFNGQSVIIDWRTPGGTSEIRRQLQAEYEAAIKRGVITTGTMPYDLLFGGGTYEHRQMKKSVSFADQNGHERSQTLSVPAGFATEQLDAWYGENSIGRANLYDPEQYWLGTAVSAFGIVYNRDIFKRMQIPEPTTWRDLTDPRLAGWVALADPSQSGSIATAFEVILQRLGWVEGWRVLQEVGANCRYFADSSSKIPIDCSLGEAAAGMCIDFYGRSQAQATQNPDGTARIVYIDPVRMTDIDSDPISILAGAPHPDLARRFISYCLSEDGQALWQFSVNDGRDDRLVPGPTEFELRRLPIRRIMYEEDYFEHFVDHVNPFDLAHPFDHWNTRARGLIGPIFTAMAINTHRELKSAWRAIHALPEDDPLRAELLDEFHRLPTITLTDGRVVDLNEVDLATDGVDGESVLGAIRSDWKYAASAKGVDAGCDPLKAARDEIGWTVFFGDQYRQIVDRARPSGR